VTEFKGPGELVAYLAALAHHKVVDEVRRRLEAEKYDVKREQSLEDSRWDLRDELRAPQATPSQVAVAEELWKRMLQGKPEHYRRILQLRREGNTYPQIADQVGVNEKTARRIIQSLFPEAD
jgi:RNA polymerase sigma factor (sigma-70 family)